MKKIRRRVLSGIIVMAILATMLLQPLSNINAKASFFRTLYIKEVKVISGEGETEEILNEAKAFCETNVYNQDNYEDNDWHVINGNLNEGAESMFNEPVSVFLVYQTTSDPNEAITDLAVMNEKGNYSVSEFEMILNEQRDAYRDIVKDMKAMLEEYRTNYKNKIQSAISAHDILNTYVDYDADKLLGDLLLDINDDDLVELLLQANGQVLLTIQDQLAYACDNKKNTWLDRMEKIGPYDNMVKSYAKAKNVTKAAAKSMLQKAYNDRAVQVLESWKDIYLHFELLSKYEKDNGKEDMSDEEWDSFIKERQEAMKNNAEASNVTIAESNKDAEFYKYIHELEFLSVLNNYIFGDKTLMAYFSQSYDEVSGDNITKLYPLAAALTDGQIGAINESVSLFSLIESAVYATAYNGYDKGKAVDLKKYADEEIKDALEDAEKESEEMIEELDDYEPTSVYAGVDREIFKGGVAVTSTAKKYSNGAQENWVNSIVDSGIFAKTAIGMAAGAICFSAASIACAVSLNKVMSQINYAEYVAQSAAKADKDALKKAMKKTYDAMYEENSQLASSFSEEFTGKMTLAECTKRYKYSEFNGSIKDVIKNKEYGDVDNIYGFGESKEVQVKNYDDVVDELKAKCNNGLGEGEANAANNTAGLTVKSRILRGLKIGFAVVAVLLAVADIAMTVYTLYNYYNREHVDIPKTIVDLSYNEDGEASYVKYTNVLTADHKPGDLNGGGGKQWLALYYTNDRSAGDPILAPDGYENEILYRNQETNVPLGYTPLHMFGSFNTPQNLTYADGESGFSYNDENDGTYLFFKRDANPDYEHPGRSIPFESTSISAGFAALIGGAGLLVGFLIALIIFRRPKKKEENVA